MRKFLTRSLAPLALLLVPAAHAQTAPQDADPALWVVKDDDTTVYLFGTVHVLKPGLSWFDEAVKTAFDKSGELVLEMVEPDEATMQGLVMKMAMDMTGPALTTKLPEDKRAAFAQVVATTPVPMMAFDRMEPWAAAMTLSVVGLPKLGYDPQSGAEKILSGAAKAANKPIVGLETAEQQLGYFDTLPEPLQVEFLISTIDEFPTMGAELDKMVAAWAKGDPDTLAATINESMRETPEIGKVLLTDRNVRWAEWIAKRMEKPGTVFVAVGAGHLAGPDSVQVQLGKHQLKATRIAY